MARPLKHVDSLYIRSGASMPSTPSPRARTEAVSAHSASRLSRTAGSAALSTGQVSKKVVNTPARSNR